MKYSTMKILFLSSLTLLIFIQNCFSQQKICGRITDEFGKPLSDVNISIKEHPDNHTYSNSHGRYCLIVPDSNSIIVFSLPGMNTRELYINQQKVVNISLKKSEILLDENVIIGYGSPNPLIAKDPFPLKVPDINLKSDIHLLFYHQNPKSIIIKINRENSKKLAACRSRLQNNIVKINGKKYYGRSEDIPANIIESIEVKRDKYNVSIMNSSFSTIIIRLKHKKDLKLINPELFKWKVTKALKNN
jgi:hypothetical protein